MNISLEDLLEIFVEAQALGRRQGLTKADWRRYYRALHQMSYENVQSRKDNRAVAKQIIDAARELEGIKTHSCSCGRHKTEKLCESAKKRSMKAKSVVIKNPFDDGSETEWERTRRYCG